MNIPRLYKRRRSKPARSVKRHARRSYSKPRRSHHRYSGSMCGGFTFCPTGVPCVDGTCKFGQLGDPCGSNVQCKTGHPCDSGKCK